MLIKFEADQLLADSLRIHYGQKTASKAFALAAADAISLYRKNQQMQETIDMQGLKILRYQQIIEQARASAMHLVEACGQGDLLDL